MDRGSRGFPQEEEFSTESYPQVWITLGTSQEITGWTGLSERMFCGKLLSLHIFRKFPIMEQIKTETGLGSSWAGL